VTSRGLALRHALSRVGKLATTPCVRDVPRERMKFAPLPIALPPQPIALAAGHRYNFRRHRLPMLKSLSANVTTSYFNSTGSLAVAVLTVPSLRSMIWSATFRWKCAA